MSRQAPRQFFADGALPTFGMPHDRTTRLAARRAFVELKQLFLKCVAEIPGRHGDWLRTQVRACEEPFDLWLLRAVVLEALAERGQAALAWRMQLKRSLQATFPEPDLASGFAPLAIPSSTRQTHSA